MERCCYYGLDVVWGMADGRVDYLISKYQVLLELRAERERLESEGVMRLAGSAAEKRQATSRSLARVYPGALKQLDQMSAALMAHRLESLEQCKAEQANELPRWAAIESAYHAVLKDFLEAKRWLGERSGQAGEEPDILSAWEELGLFRGAIWGELQADTHLLERIKQPPQGRLSELAWEVLQQSFRVSADVLKAEFSSWQEGS